jgi:hypothetical protein
MVIVAAFVASIRLNPGRALPRKPETLPGCAGRDNLIAGKEAP